MYAFVRGILRETCSSHVIVEVGGKLGAVGYQLFTPANIHSKLPSLGEEVMLYTAFIVRENEQSLYAFISSEEKQLFLTVTSVSGVGPKLGLALLGHLSIADFQEAIGAADTRVLCSVPGIGKRMAERMVLELKGRLPALFPRDLSDNPKEKSASSELLQDALSALMNLGYTQAMAQKALSECRCEAASGMVLSELIAVALGKI